MVPGKGAELVIGLVGAIGTDLHAAWRVLRRSLESVAYDAQLIHLSKMLHEVPGYEDLPESPLDVRVARHMDAGNDLREFAAKAGLEGVMAALAIGRIRRTRLDKDGDKDKPIPRTAYVIRSLKHPDEVRVLRDVYGERFLLMSVYAPRTTRMKKLTRDIARSRSKPVRDVRELAEQLNSRDEEESENPFGQNVRDTFHRAGVFLDGSTPTKLKASIDRIVEIAFGNPFRTPSRDEFAMFHAEGAEARSADLGRQVGAAIATCDGDIIALGTNEVPRAGGGLYWEGDPHDARDFVQGVDPNHERRDIVLADIMRRLKEAEWLSEAKASVDVDRLVERARESGGPLRKSLLMSVIEFGRTVHAEMAAICDAAHRGVAIRGMALYTTTFPCHLCAKHIIAAGLTRVVYIEPYPKSLAPDLYPDSLDVDPDREAGLVVFKPFVGVAPRKYLRFFKMPESSSRKTEGGHPVEWVPKIAEPKLSGTAREYVSNEKAIMSLLDDILEQKAASSVEE